MGIGIFIMLDLWFIIIDFFFEWVYVFEGVKVLVIGVFLGSYMNVCNFKWCCMFGDIEVFVEVIGIGVFRCKVFFFFVGKVFLYVICGDC